MKFNIVLALPPEDRESFVHAQCFLETADLLRYGLEDLGYEVIFGEGLQRDHLNIILGYQFLYGQKISSEYKCIVYQLEELSELEGWPLKNLETLMSPSCVVWDFSERNIDFLAERGIRAVLKPLGFHQKMFRIKYRQNKDVDILFYGSKNERRMKILKELERKFNVEILCGIYGHERDEWIARSKIVLSIYYYQTKLFDDVRIGYLMNNKSFSIIEDSPNKKYDDFLVYIPYEQLVERCEYYLNNDDLRREKAKQAFQGFRKYPESEFLKRALAQSF